MTTDKKKYDELRKKVEFQVKCEERAYRIVERLIENPGAEDFFQESLNFITPSHYHDIVEERAVSKLCGYPLCPKPLKKVLNQKYVISTKTNKVYDIEERKNFCSGKCYKASVHVEKQISSAPVWTRKSHPLVPFSFLPLDMEKGKVGEEVFLNMADDLKEEIKTIEKMDKYQQHLEERKAKLSNIQGSHRVSDGHSDVTSASDGEKCVYTLDKVMKEIGMDGQDGEVHVSGKSGNDNQRSVKSGQKQTDIKNTNIVENSDCATRETFDIQTSTKNVNLPPKLDSVTRHPIEVSNVSSEIKAKDATSSSIITTRHVKGKAKGTNPQAEYLMKLLDKRKALLYKMADIQSSSDKQTTSDINKVAYYESANHQVNLKHEEIDNKSTRTETSLVASTRSSENATENPEAKNVKQHQPESVQSKTGMVEDENLSAKKVEELQSDVGVQLQTENQNPKDSDLKPLAARKIASPIQMIVDVLKEWMTKESLKYLSVDVTSNSIESRDMFEKQYKKLAAKVDAQEKEFDNMLGEELIDKTEDAGRAPVPDYEQLKRETEENSQRVNAFLTGAFTYRIKEKTPTEISTENTPKVVLPTVDRYNQMLIRQKIVLDRISKVLPELLSPLRLLIQDVFTELRELVSTFELTSENILFKPAEWMLVTLIVLKLLCRRIEALEQAFTGPRAKSHFGILLKAVGCDTELDNLVQSLLHISV